VQRETIRTFRPEDLLLVLAVHGSKHSWSRLEWVCDVSQLLATSPGLDWQEVWRQAVGLGVSRMLLLALRLARDLLGAALPEEMRARAYGDAAVGALARRVSARFYRGEVIEPGIVDYCLFHLRARERWRDRMQYIARRVTSTTWEDWATLSLPSRLFPLYYVLRPVLLPVKLLQFLRHGDRGLLNRGGVLSGHWPITSRQAMLARTARHRQHGGI
jgi:hypothetical protein